MKSLIYFGGTLKAMDDAGKIGGYLVRFSDDGKQKDLAGEYFTSKTYLGSHEGNGVDCIFHHAQPIPVKNNVSAAMKKEIAALQDVVFEPVKTKRDAVGIWAETVLDMADAYQAAVFGLVKAGKLGWSSGAVAHMVKRHSDGQITRWPIGEASITPCPCEPLNRAVDMDALRSIKFVKGIFQEAMDVQTPSRWEMESTYGSVVRKIAAAASVARASGAEFDLEAMLSEATNEYSSMLQETALGQIKEWLDAGATEEFYLKTMAGVEELVTSFDDRDFDSHSQLTVSVLRGFASRLHGRHEARQKQKPGRVMSEKNRQLVASTIKDGAAVVANLQALLDESAGVTDHAEKRARETERLRARHERRLGRR
jgi:hypothetical protein